MINMEQVCGISHFLDKPERHLVFSENGKPVVHHQVERSANFVDSLSEENGMAYN